MAHDSLDTPRRAPNRPLDLKLYIQGTQQSLSTARNHSCISNRIHRITFERVVREVENDELGATSKVDRNGT